MSTTSNFNFDLIPFDTIPYQDREYNNWHMVDALFARFLAISNVKGPWINGLSVAVGDRYIDTDSDTIWTVLVAHTTSSSTTFSVDRATTPTNWESFTTQIQSAGTWTTATSYSVNDFVLDAGRYGIVTSAYISGASYDADVTSGNIVTLVDVSTIVSTSPVANTLPVGASATVAYNSGTGVFTFGIPTGATGATGAIGVDGVDGVFSAIASQVEAEAGTENTKGLTPLRGKQLLDALGLLASNNGSDFADIPTTLLTLGGIGAATTNTLTNKTFDANGTGNSLSNVDVADFAAGTGGELITWDASGNPATVPVGTATDVLTSNGAGAAPTFQTPAAGGSLVFITSITATAAASVDFDAQLSSTYDQYLLIGTDIHPDVDNSELYLRTDSNGGVSYDAGASDYQWTVDGFNSSGATSGSLDVADAQINLIGTNAGSNMGNAAAECTFLRLWINNPAGTTYHKLFNWDIAAMRTTGAAEVITGSGRRIATTAIDSFQLLPQTGNISGTFRLYGVANS